MILQTSHTLTSSLLDIGRQPVASGGSGDIYKGTLNSSTVCAKRVSVYSKDGTRGTKTVCHQRHHFSASSLTYLTEPLPGYRVVETFGVPEYHSPPGHHYQFLLLISEWMPMEYIKNHPETNRPGLVGVLPLL